MKQLIEKQKKLLVEIIRVGSHIDFRTQCVIMTQARSPSLCYMRHSQNFDKIYSFLKPDLDIFILHNFILW